MATEAQAHVTQWEVSCLPRDHREFGHFSIAVEWRGGDRWAVTHFRQCLSRSGEWDFEPLPSSREDEWLDEHQFAMDEALELAKREAPEIRVNGWTVDDVLGAGDGE